MTNIRCNFRWSKDPFYDALDRGIDLSTISQSSLAGIELYKALTSDKDADAIAGSVNLVTKKLRSIENKSSPFRRL